MTAPAPAPPEEGPSSYPSWSAEMGSLVATAPSGDGSTTSAVSESDPEVGNQEFNQVRFVHQTKGHSYFDKNKLREERRAAGISSLVALKFMKNKWKTVPSPLPPNIYVWKFKKRLDLMRVIIVGATGTPLQDNLFWFDCRISLNYPMTPLEITYRNAFPGLFNLGEQAGIPYGTVSRLFTFLNDYWTAPVQMQMTMPVQVDLSNVSDRRDNLGETLVWLQNWIQSGHQFLWEAGSDASIHSCWEYREIVVFMNLKNILLMLQTPPRHRIKFVNRHFWERGEHIVRTYESYAWALGDVHYSLSLREAISYLLPNLRAALKKPNPKLT